jgi:hypothetical protein
MTATQRNIGGGNEGEGGPLGDAAVIDTTNRNSNRGQADYGVAPTRSAPLPIIEPATTTADDFASSQYVFQGELNDRILVHTFDLDGEGTTNIQIAKPQELRVSVDDVVLEDGTIISRDNVNRRKITKGTLIRYEVISPPYTLNDLIYGSKVPTTGVAGVTLIDQNNDARRWVDEEPDEQWFVVLDVYKDVLVCRVWDWSTGEAIEPDPLDPNPDGPILVAKPYELRATTWLGTHPITGVIYTSPGNTVETDPYDTRVADNDAGVIENQLIIPVYHQNVVNGSIIKATRCNQGTGSFHNSVESLWQAHDHSRAWAKEFE